MAIDPFDANMQRRALQLPLPWARSGDSLVAQMNGRELYLGTGGWVSAAWISVKEIETERELFFRRPNRIGHTIGTIRSNDTFLAQEGDLLSLMCENLDFAASLLLDP